MESSIGWKDTKLTYNSFLYKNTHLQLKHLAVSLCQEGIALLGQLCAE